MPLTFSASLMTLESLRVYMMAPAVYYRHLFCQFSLKPLTTSYLYVVCRNPLMNTSYTVVSTELCLCVLKKVILEPDPNAFHFPPQLVNTDLILLILRYVVVLFN